jgi:hypothetical protein
MVGALILATILSVTDPPGDAIGNGSLRPPTDVVFRTTAAFDVRRIDVFDTPEFSFAITFEQLSNPWELPYGFSLPIVEIYLATGDEGGQADLLPGSGMSLAAGQQWNYAFRITGESFAMLAANPFGGDPIDVTERLGAELYVEGNTLYVDTLLTRPSRFSLYGMVGGYDPFTESGWRPVRREPSPWSFSSDSQTVPVVEVIADTFELQVRAIDSGILPEIRAGTQTNSWLLVAGLGTLIGVLGFAARLTLRPPAPSVSAQPASPPGIPLPSEPLPTEPLPPPARAPLPWPLPPPSTQLALPPPKPEPDASEARPTEVDPPADPTPPPPATDAPPRRIDFDPEVLLGDDEVLWFEEAFRSGGASKPNSEDDVPADATRKPDLR